MLTCGNAVNVNVENFVMNTWPDGKRRAMTQCEHAAWNAYNYPGTLQLCCQCKSETGRCEEDEIYLDDGETGPLCEECYHNSDEYKLQDS